MEKSLTYMVEPQEDTWTPRFGGALLTGNILHKLSHIDAGKVQHPDSMRKGKKCPTLTWTLLYVHLPLAKLTLHPLPTTNGN